ncbi:MAG: Cytochrome b561 [Candidatus Celerinatantimonas neptuna]|nr:MAG: Cytochrome b561 [Candidatus Celerinatantimonas neptuna]
MNNKHRLSHITISLHWLIALTIIGLWIVGYYMMHWSVYPLYDIHKSIGVIVFLFIVVRVIWRLFEGWPVPVTQYQKMEHLLAQIVHWVLLISTITMPVFGMLWSGASGYGFGIFHFQIIHANINSGHPHQVIPYSVFWAKVGEIGHVYNAYILLGALALHIIGALKHHLVDKDGLLLRMLGYKVNKG